MKILISRREPDGGHPSKREAIFTLTVDDGSKRVSVNILRDEAYRVIDAHELTPYDQEYFDAFTENRWDNIPATETGATTETETTTTQPTL